MRDGYFRNTHLLSAAHMAVSVMYSTAVRLRPVSLTRCTSSSANSFSPAALAAAITGEKERSRGATEREGEEMRTAEVAGISAQVGGKGRQVHRKDAWVGKQGE